MISICILELLSRSQDLWDVSLPAVANGDCNVGLHVTTNRLSLRQNRSKWPKRLRHRVRGVSNNFARSFSHHHQPHTHPHISTPFPKAKPKLPHSINHNRQYHPHNQFTQDTSQPGFM